MALHDNLGQTRSLAHDLCRSSPSTTWENTCPSSWMRAPCLRSSTQDHPSRHGHEHMPTTTQNDRQCKSLRQSGHKHHTHRSGVCFRSDIDVSTELPCSDFDRSLSNCLETISMRPSRYRHVNVLTPRRTRPLKGPTPMDDLAADRLHAVPQSQTQPQPSSSTWHQCSGGQAQRSL